MRGQTRRLLIGLVLGVLLAVPLAAEAQQAGTVFRIGILNTGVPSRPAKLGSPLKELLEALAERGYVEGRNLILEWRGADWKPERLPDLAAELVRLKVDVIFVAVCGAPLNAARHATRTIPIVVGTCNDDLVSSGVIASLARPGGNVTGLSKLTPELAAKRLGLLKEAFPKSSRVAVLWNPDYSDFQADWRELQAAARTLRVTLQPVEVRRADEFDDAFSRMLQERADAFIMFSDIVGYFFRTSLVAAAAKSRLPGIYAFREAPDAGGLMSYGPNIVDMFRRAAVYIDKIFRGARPADLPVEQPTKFELVINMKTAKALGLTIPPAVLVRADQVIE